ncbi:hypothetical protein [Curtobacterium flaccumfaciens]|uniref:hypothetical protein n=1 Tax=Curtobacterium flaccumfaciens TaxID=2035 RepID=UPI003992A37B
MTWSDLQPFATAIAGFAAAAAFVLTFLRERHPLTAIERLTTVADKIRSQEVRQLVEDYRDERATRWVLEQRSPRDRRLRWTGIWLRIAATFAFIVWMVSAVVSRLGGWGWVTYAAAIALFIAGNAVMSWRQSRRNTWIEQEQQWRGITPSAEATVARKEGAQ